MKKFADWFNNNWHIVLFGTLMVIGLLNIYESTAGHKKEVTLVSQQNAGCIYLESSRLGEGQHYMICNGQITLVRVGDVNKNPSEVSTEVVEDAVATPAPAAK
jgi:hypothetical protein